MLPTPDEITAAIRDPLGVEFRSYRAFGVACWLGADVARVLDVPLGEVEHALRLARDRLECGKHWALVEGVDRLDVIEAVAAARHPAVDVEDPLLVLFSAAVLEVPLWLDTQAAKRVSPSLRRLIPRQQVALHVDVEGVHLGLPRLRSHLRLVPGDGA